VFFSRGSIDQGRAKKPQQMWGVAAESTNALWKFSVNNRNNKKKGVYEDDASQVNELFSRRRVSENSMGLEAVCAGTMSRVLETQIRKREDDEKAISVWLT
jgi:hypothetical protein